MALFFSNFNNPHLTSSSLSFPFLSPPSRLKSPIPKQFSVRSVSSSNENGDKSDEKESSKPKKRLSEQSSWEAKDSEGEDYLYRLGKEADNMNIAVGGRAGVIDDLFAGNFLGRDCECFFRSTLISLAPEKMHQKKEGWGICEASARRYIFFV